MKITFNRKFFQNLCFFEALLLLIVVVGNTTHMVNIVNNVPPVAYDKLPYFFETLYVVFGVSAIVLVLMSFGFFSAWYAAKQENSAIKYE